MIGAPYGETPLSRSHPARREGFSSAITAGLSTIAAPGSLRTHTHPTAGMGSWRTQLRHNRYQAT